MLVVSFFPFSYPRFPFFYTTLPLLPHLLPFPLSFPFPFPLQRTALSSLLVSYATTHPFHSLSTPITRASIDSYYGAPCLMYLQLRTLGALLYEKDLGKMDPHSVLEFMVGKERYGGWPSQYEVIEKFGRD